MYILYLQPLITDILFQLLYMGYVAPAIIVQVCSVFLLVKKLFSIFIDLKE